MYPAGDLNGIVNDDARVPFAVREVIARLVDGSEIVEFKPTYGTTVLYGFARLWGFRDTGRLGLPRVLAHVAKDGAKGVAAVPLGIVANDGGIFSERALKATHFIEMCNQRCVPPVHVAELAHRDDERSDRADRARRRAAWRVESPCNASGQRRAAARHRAPRLLPDHAQLPERAARPHRDGGRVVAGRDRPDRRVDADAPGLLGTLYDQGSVRQRLAMLQAKVDAARAALYKAAWQLEHDDAAAVRSVSGLKAFACELANQVMYTCVQFHGGLGYMRETPVERMSRDARVLSIGGGATEVMLEEIAKRTP